MRYLRTESKSADDTLHVLTREEQASLRRIQRRAVFRAGCAGALSAAFSGAAAVVATELGLVGFEYWLTVGSVTAVASVFEIGFLYGDGLRATREMAAHAGLSIDPDQGEAELALSLCRAALELPSPPENSLRVDPHREVSKIALILASILYKAKIALSSFILKALLRRALGRAAMRSVFEFVAVPVTALWNAVVAHWVLGEARLRIIGPSAALQLSNWASASEGLRPYLADAVACVIVKARSVHPNIEQLAKLFLGTSEPGVDLGNVKDFLTRLRELDRSESVVVLRTLCAAAIIDGRLSRRERQLLNAAFSAVGRAVPWPELEALRKHMIHGDGLRADLLEDLGGRLLHAS
jgi:hypothetical protein